MAHEIDSVSYKVSLPHHRLDVYGLALEFVRLIHSIRIGTAKDRSQAREASASCARNIAEASGRPSAADRSRVFGIARGECIEAIASVEIAEAAGQCAPSDVARVLALGGRVSAMLSRLIK